MCVCVCVCVVVLMCAHRFSVILFCNKVIHACVCVYVFVDAKFSTILFYKVCAYERICIRMCLYVSVSMFVFVHGLRFP